MKKRKFIAAVMALSMIFGQTVYAQEYTVPEETLAESTEAVETKVSEETVENETEKTAETAAELAEQETEKVTAEPEVMAAEETDSAIALNEGENAVEIAEADSYALASFIPEESGKYFIYSTGDEDTKATLYDSDMEYITDDDDGGENTNFKLSCQFESGKTYYIRIRYYNDSTTGTINVTVEKLSNKCGDNAIWSLDEEGTLTISGEGAVTSAPWQGETIRRLVIEEGITDLDNITFQNSTELVSVQWPSTIKTIPSSCFAGCRSLKTIDIPAGVESIDDWAFQGCSSLLKAVIPSTVTYISVYDVFADCAKNFYILGYKESEAERYANENNIRFVDAANPVIPIEICDITLEQGAVEYDGTAKTPKVTVRDGDIELVEGEDYSVEYANNQDIGTASVTVTGIGNIYTGEEKLEFQIVKISDKLTVGDNYVRISIGSDSNTDMASVFFKPEEDGFYTFKMDSLGDKTIQDFRSSGVSTYTNSWDTTKVIVPVEKLYADDKYDLEVQSKIGSDTIVRITIEKRETTGEINGVSWNLSDEGVLTIDGTDLTQAAVDGIDLWRSFQSDTKKLIIGKNVTTIPYDSFEEFRVLESLELPEGLLEIGSYAFNGCQKLKNVVLPSSLKTIESGAFKRCGFKGIDVPESVESIGSSALGYDESGNLIDAFYIIGKSGSKAEAYANENNINFIDKDNPVVPISSCDVKVPKYAFYEGTDVIPSVQVSFNSEKLVEGTDYTLAYENNHTVGTGTVVVTGIGKYTGSVSVNFEIKEMKTYEKTLVTGNSWLTISNEYYDSDEGEYKFDWEYSDKDQLIAESNDSSVCKVLKVYGEKPKYGDEEEQNVCLKIQGIKSGNAVIVVKDADGSALFKCNVTVKQLPDDAVVFEDEALQGQLIEDYDKNEDGYLSTKEVENIRRISISGSYHGEQVKSLAGLEQAANATSFSLSEGSSVTDITVLGQLKQLEDLDIRDINIDNLEGISNCTNLEWLYLDGCQVGSWEGIEKLTNLERLSLSSTNFSNAELLSGMQKLEKLSLDYAKELTNIKPLAVLDKLNSLTLSESGVSDQDKWDFANIQDLTVIPGEKFAIPRYANLLLDLSTTISEGEECISDLNWGKYTALKQGTVKMHLVYKEKFSTDITITVNAGEDQTVGSDYENKVEVKSADDFDVSQILDSNGDLWTTTPELKKTHTGVKQYVADYVYEKNGSDDVVKKFMGYYLDVDNTLWSDNDIKIAENIIEAASGGAMDSEGNFYDLHSDNPQPISGVTKWVAGSTFTYLMKADGSLWRRNVWQDTESFEKICDKVLDITKWSYYTGAYIKADGTIVVEAYYSSGCSSYNENVTATSFGNYKSTYYDQEGNLHSLNLDCNLGKITVADMSWFRFEGEDYYDLILTEEGDIYTYNEDKEELKKIDSGAKALNHASDTGNWMAIDEYWQYQKENGYYKTNGSEIKEVSSALIMQLNGDGYRLYNNYDGHEGAFVRYDTVFLDHVTTIWADYVTVNWTDKNKVYALRTDGSVWDVTNAPTKLGSLGGEKHEHTIVTDPAVAATTDKPGKTEGSHCSECGEVLTAQKDTVVTTPLTAAKANDKGGIDVSWKKVSYADGYLVYRKSGKESWKRVAELKGADDNSWTDTTGTIGTAYTYTVRAYMNSDGENILGGFDSKGVTATVLPATVVLKKAADNGKKGIDVTWEKVSGATGYRIYRKTSGGSWKGLTNVTSESTTSYTDSTVAAGTTYFYTVRAYKTVNGSDVYGGFDNTGVSASVKAESQSLGTVVLDKTADSGKGSIIVRWKAVEGAEGYRIYKKFTGSSWQKVTDVASDKLSYDDGSGVTGKTYTYTVRAFKHVDGKEVLGGFDSKGLTATKLPAKVTLKAAKDNGKGGITVSWNKVSTATGYRVYRKEAGGSWKGLGNVTSNATITYTDQNVTAGKSYTYTVRAYKEYEGKSHQGDYDKTGKTATVTSLRGTVKLLGATAEAGRKITVTWEKAGDCDGYILYRKSGSGSWSRLTKVTDKNANSHTDGSGTAGTTYTYTVRAYKTSNGKEVLGGFDSKGVSAECKE